MYCSVLRQTPSPIIKIALPFTLAILWTLFVLNPVYAQDEPTVTVAHFAAFGADVEGTSVTVAVDGVDTLTDFQFGDVEGPLSLPAGEYLLEVKVGDTVAISATAALTTGVDYVVAAIGDIDNQPLELVILENDSDPEPGFAKVRVAHFSPFADDVNATAVDICNTLGTPILPNFQYSSLTSGYLELAPGTYELVVAAAGTDCEPLYTIPAITLSDGDITDLYAIGYPPGDKAEDFPFRVTSISGVTLAAAAQVTVGHFAAFGETVAETAVDIRVNGADVLTDVVFGQISAALSVPVMLPPTDYLVEVVANGTTAISATVNLEADTSYFVAAIGDGVNQPLELLPLINETEPVTEAAKLRLAHLAPFAADLGQTAVDICHNEGTPVLENIAYKDVTAPYLQLPAGDYNLVVSVAGTDCAPVFNLPALNLSAGTITDAFAIGYPVGDKATNFPFTVATSTGLTLSDPVTVTVGHFAPFGDTIADTSVSIYVNGTEVLSNTVFGQTATLNTAPGRVRIDVVPTADIQSSQTITPAISEVLTLTQGMDYTVLAIGGANGWPLDLQALVNDRLVDPENAKVRIGHFAPFAEGSAATEVAICTVGNDVVGGLAAVPYGVVTESYLTLAPGSYALKISAANDCSQTILELPVLALAAGDIIEVYATGLNTAEFPLAPVIVGEVEIEEPEITYTVYLPILSKGGDLPSIVDIAVGNANFSTLVSAVIAANLAGTLGDVDGDFTVFAPTNAAFEALPEGTLDALLADPGGQLTQILLYHVIAGTVPSSALSEGLRVETLQGSEVEFSLEGGPSINGVNIIQADIFASNGVIHVIDAVLLPPAEENGETEE